MRAQVLDVQGTADHGLQPWIIRNGARNVQLRVAEVANAWREAKAQRMHQREHVVREAGGVRVVLLDAQV